MTKEFRYTTFLGNDFKNHTEESLQKLHAELISLDEKVTMEVVEAEKKVVDVKKQLGHVRNNKRTIKRMLSNTEHERFKRKLFKEHGGDLSQEQLEKIFSKAYERGHSSGYHEVQNEFIDLMELFD